MSTYPQLPTLGPIVLAARRAVVRFPLVLAVAVVSVVSAILIFDDIGPASARDRLLAAASLGIPLFTALALLGERRLARGGKAAAAVGGLLVLGAVYLLWPGWSDPTRFGRYVQLSAAFHLFVAFAPFRSGHELNGFWHYNRALLERLILGALYTIVLYAGLAVALAAVDQLLGVDVPDVGYGRLWVTAAFLCNTWFFLAGIPADLAELDRRSDYPAALKAFTQYALIPLIVVYLVILMVYLGKVVVTWDWPSGWIGWLVSSVAAAGILASLLVHPVADDPANRWVATYSRWLYIALMPAIVMLWLAIWQRIDQYGVTEPRYFLLVLSVWLAAVAVYYAVTRSRNIWLIPASLCAVGILTVAGPWGAYRVSERSQMGRLEALLVGNDRLVEGRARPSTRSVAFEDRREIAAVFRYLIETHGIVGNPAWFGDSLRQIDSLAAGARPSSGNQSRARRVMGYLNIDYVDRWQREPEQSFSYRSDWEDQMLPVAGFDFAVPVTRGRAGAAIDTGLVALPALLRKTVQIRHQGAVLLELDLTEVLDAAAAHRRGDPDGQIPLEIMRISGEAAGVRATLYLNGLWGTETDEGLQLEGVDGRVLVALR